MTVPQRALPQRVLGRTKLVVSQLGFGGAVIGIPRYLMGGDRDDEAFRQQAHAALVRAVELGLNYFDTAPGYGDGRSEERIGEALSRERDHVVLATKVKVTPSTSAETWWASVRSSMVRLRSSSVDLLQLHGNTWSIEQAEWVLKVVVPWLREVQADGLARFVGVTAEAPSGGLEVLIRSGEFDTLQIAYNAIYQAACDYQREPFGVIPLAREFDMGVLTMRTTTSAVLQKLLWTEFPDLDVTRIARLAINFVLSTPEVDCALVGMTSVAEVEENVRLASSESSRIDLRDLHNRFT